MQKSYPGWTRDRAKSDQVSSDRIGRFLRQLYPAKTADMVSADTGITATTIKSWLNGATVPGGLAMIVLIDAYGPDFLHAVMPSPPQWLDAAHRAERQARLEAEIARCRRELGEIT